MGRTAPPRRPGPARIVAPAARVASAPVGPGHTTLVVDRRGLHVGGSAAGAPVRTDGLHLPFRRGAFGAAWAGDCDAPWDHGSLPMVLAELHDALSVGAPLELGLALDQRGGGGVDALTGGWRDVLTGAGFDVEAFEVVAERRRVAARARRAHTLPDRVLPGMVLLVCGLNPSLYAANRGVPFARPGNRFWPALIAAGLADRPGDPSHALHHHGVGFTDLVKRASRRADELAAADYRDGAARVERLVQRMQPAAVCFLGLSGYRLAVDPAAVAGPLPAGFGGRPAYLMPNPSGLNAHTKPAGFAEHLRRAVELGRSSSLTPAPNVRP